MRAFPQLKTSALVQFPFRGVARKRSVTNRTCDDRLIQALDADYSFVGWELQFDSLDRAECEDLEKLFEDCEGSLQPFTFLDPNANLLAGSDDFTSAFWVKDPLLQIVAGQNDPWGGQTATDLINLSQAAQGIGQVLAVPAGFCYSFGLLGRSVAPATVRLLMGGGGQPLTKVFPLGSQWERLALSGNLGEGGDSVRFAIQIPPGVTVGIAGAQVESGLSPTDYKRTSGPGGIFQSTYFDQDELDVEATGPNAYSCFVRLASRAA